MAAAFTNLLKPRKPHNTIAPESSLASNDDTKALRKKRDASSSAFRKAVLAFKVISSLPSLLGALLMLVCLALPPLDLPNRAVPIDVWETNGLETIPLNGLMASSSLYLLSVTLEAAVRQQTGQSMLVWTYSDIGEVCEFLTGCFAYGYAFQRKKPGIAVASGILCCIFNVLVVYGMKRIANTLTWTFRERTRSFAFSFGSMQIKWFVFQVFVSIARTRCLFAFPFQDDHEVGFSHMLLEGDTRNLGCSDEAAFMATFKFPYKFTHLHPERHGYEIDCADPLCGYRTWQDACHARLVAPVASSIGVNSDHLLIFPTFASMFFLGLIGSGRIQRVGTDGTYDFSGLLAPHILAALGCFTAAIYVFIYYLTIFFLDLPTLYAGTAPEGGVDVSCGYGSSCMTVLGESFLLYALEGLAFSLLLVDTLQKCLHARRRFRRKHFLSYKQGDGNDVAVRRLKDLLPGQNWFDKDQPDKGTQAMINGVLGCDVFIAIISEKYFLSEYCKLELGIAIREQKPIMVVHNVNSPIKEVLQWVPQELAVLKDIEFRPIADDDEAIIQHYASLLSKCLDSAAPFRAPMPESVQIIVDKYAQPAEVSNAGSVA
mmetsp:Transcript_267/g.490  ORF Transcript_267/g.490 Transcript_267/m.490 type:complete len:600 (+) Transcript_267:224-2023(+)